MPEDDALGLVSSIARRHYRQISDTLRIQMDFAVEIAREPFKLFQNDSLRAMAPVNKRRNDGEPQVSESSGAKSTPVVCLPRIGRREPRWGDGITSQGAARNKRSAGNPRKTPSSRKWRETGG